MDPTDASPHDDKPSPTAHRIAELIRERRDGIVRSWEAAVRAMPRARELDPPRLIDHIPDLLERIAQAIDELGHGRIPTSHHAAAKRHAMSRLEEGFDLQEVIGELRVLRQCIFRVLAEPTLGIVLLDELRALDDAIDAAISGSVEHYIEIRERTLQGFDRVTTAALESSSLDDLLRRLLQVLQETTPAIDTSSIYLRDGDLLRVRAAVGVAGAIEQGVAMRIGEGFAGAIAARGEPMPLHHPTAAQLRNPAMARAGIRVLHGVPIVDRNELIGVAKIGSRTAEQFSLQDQRIFAAMVARASAAIVQHLLRDQTRRASELLAEQERQFRALADNIPQLSWMADAAGQRYWYNRRWYEYTGTTPEEAQGSGWRKTHHPEHVERVYERWMRAVERGEPWEDTFPLRGADGVYRWFLSRAVPIRDASGAIERWFGTNTDVTERRFLDHATEVLSRTLDEREALEQLARLAVPDIADWCIVDLVARGQLEHVAIAHGNPAKLEAAWHYARSQPDPAGYDATWQIVRTGKPALAAEISDEMLAATARDAEHLRVLRELGFRSWIGAPLVARGAAIGVIHLVMNDSGRRYRASDLEVAVELGHRAGVAIDNARLYREAQVAIQVRDDLLAIVSHDLGNPLHAINLGVSLLFQQYGTDARARKHIDAIRRSADRMERLINDLLDMASINAGKLAITPAPVDARELVTEVLDSQEPAAHERGITITRDCNLGPVALHVDRDRIAQAFGNLLGNAIKFCAPGDVIAVRAERVSDAVRFSFADTGPGIAPDDVPHIFEPYWSGRGGRKKGTGLGLFITRAIVEAHGGTITIDSQPGAGASFVVTLPIVNVGTVSATTDRQSP
ncbi:MAG TPA: ATP-binding protein [Kofleriaceae bacterium]|jgi:PAS domain S-box-containing protein|nr:ATP-binding protein [Kofleriaceae bacterium]